MADNIKTTDSSDNFVERIKEYVDKRFDKMIAQNRDDVQVQNTNLNGYRSLGTFQIMQSQDSTTSSYVIGGPGDPLVGG